MTLENMPPQRPNDKRGWLCFTDVLPESLQRLEDQRLELDLRQRQWSFGGYTFERPATDTERILLQHLGFVLPQTLTTRVEHLSGTSVRRRTWPQLEGQTL